MRTTNISRWRRAALAGALGAVLAQPALAQSSSAPAAKPAAPAEGATAKPADDAAKPARSETQPTPAAPSEVEATPANPPPPGDIQPVPGSPDEYTVQKGDTLWDLSQKFLNNPWYWPKIWSLNPAIENPHWIYPGNKLRITPGQGGPEAPAQVEPEPKAVVQQEAADAPTADDLGVQVGTNPSADLKVVRRGQPSDNGSVRATGRLAFRPQPLSQVMASGLVSADVIANAGTLVASFEEKELLSSYDTAYVRFGKNAPLKTGDKLLLFRRTGDVVHPLTNKTLAARTETTGEAKVMRVEGNLATVLIERVFGDVNRGDLVRPFEKPERRIAPRTNTSDLDAVIVGGLIQDVTTLGEANEVFIDKGAAEGVQEGNTFSVIRRGDGLNETLVVASQTAGAAGASAAKIDTPEEDVGQLIVVEVFPHLSTALVVKSVRELMPGDRAHMRVQGSGGSGSH